jgi:hypothetical protein
MDINTLRITHFEVVDDGTPTVDEDVEVIIADVLKTAG